MTTRRVIFYGLCQAAGLFGAAYYVFLATETPGSYLGRLMRLREN